MLHISGPGGDIMPIPRMVPNASERTTKTKVARKWSTRLLKPCRQGDAQLFTLGNKISGGPVLCQVPR